MPFDEDGSRRARVSRLSSRMTEEKARFRRSKTRVAEAKAMLREASEAQSQGDARRMCKLLVKGGALLDKPTVATSEKEADGERVSSKKKKKKGVNVQARVRKALLLCLQGLDFEDEGTQQRSEVQVFSQHIKTLVGGVSLHGCTSGSDWLAISSVLGSVNGLAGGRRDQKAPAAIKPEGRADRGVTSMPELPDGFSWRPPPSSAPTKTATPELPDGFSWRTPLPPAPIKTADPGSKPSTSSRQTQATGSELPASADAPASSLPNYAFPADPGDHAETPCEAYSDIEALLVGLANTLGKARGQLRIWDPFYCQGSMKLHLATLGFTNVHNVNEDFYEVIGEQSRIPGHDVIVTNPPFSTGHVERTLRFCSSNRKPWMLLMPAYVHGEPHFARAFNASATADMPMYLKPWRRYAYLRPAGLMKGYQRATSIAPFESLWYLNFYKDTGMVLSEWHKAPHQGCCLFKTRDSMLEAPQSAQVARTEKRPNPKARKRAAEKINAMRR